MRRAASGLEVRLLHRALGALAAGHRNCARCRRTPLVGERLHIYEDERVLCELCRRTQRQAPTRVEIVLGAEHGHAVRMRPRAA